MDTMLLQRHVLLDNARPELISKHALANVAQHRLHLCGHQRDNGGGYFRHVGLDNVSLSNLSFGSEAIVEGGPPIQHYYIFIALTGTLTIDSDGKSVTVDSGSLAVINPFRDVKIYHSEDCRKLIIRIRRNVMERELTSILGSSIREPLTFVPSMSLEDPRLASSLRMIDHVYREVDDPYSRFRTTRFSQRMEELLCASLLTGITHGYTEEIGKLCEHGGPSYLRRAERYVSAHLSENISLSHLVRASGASMKTLYKAFNTYHNTTPMGYVMRTRLERARRELENCNGSLRTVSEIAMAVGMEHLGNFSAYYKRVYRELPSDTLRRYS
ncbi:AraC family transcriptional regulator [Xanthobacter sediminis]